MFFEVLGKGVVQAEDFLEECPLDPGIQGTDLQPVYGRVSLQSGHGARCTGSCDSRLSSTYDEDQHGERAEFLVAQPADEEIDGWKRPLALIQAENQGSFRPWVPAEAEA
jgi:hypothetical protein